ncbi:hypothetical protein [Polycladomyces subterraneus]|uniref:CPBP family intramembrane metalloprotease n=1 Tax=Polycladomyces subterraneus TaxID=1016997 RepID=A0ABT8IKS4_9BACL|nr:hypothetical protein [Polycladomyces subterraneus]MDN4592754.1 hypothetical protein [Polycladomyces subterraneus]
MKKGLKLLIIFVVPYFATLILVGLLGWMAQFGLQLGINQSANSIILQVIVFPFLHTVMMLLVIRWLAKEFKL